MSMLNDLSQLLLDSMKRLRETSKGDLKEEIERSRATATIAKQIVDIERTKVEQAKLLINVGLPAQVGDIVVQKADKDAHPKILKP